MKRLRGLAPLRNRAFRLLVGGQLLSGVGDGLYAVALPWYVLAVHGGVVLLGTVLAAYGVPRVVVLMVGGAMADRWRPWTGMVMADATRMLAVGALAFVALEGPADAAVLIPIAVVLGAGEGLFLPGAFAIVPELLDDADLQAGNGLNQGVVQLAALAGPALGGLVVALSGASVGFLLDAVTFAVSALSLLGVRACARVPAQQQAGSVGTEPDEAGAGVAEGRAGGDVRGGEARGAGAGAPMTLRRLFATERVLQVIVVVVFAANLGFGGMSEVALPTLARGSFHAGASGYGLLIAAFGAGALVGTVVTAHVGRVRRPAVPLTVALVVGAGCLAAVPFTGGVVAAGGALAAFAVLNAFGDIVAITALQRWAPGHLLGKVMALVMMGSLGVFPVSVLFAGLVIRSLGVAAFFPLTAGVLVLALVGGLTQPSWRSFGADPEEPVASVAGLGATRVPTASA